MAISLVLNFLKKESLFSALLAHEGNWMHLMSILGFPGGSAAAAAKLLQWCPILCDPIDGSPPDSPVPGFSRQEHWSGLPLVVKKLPASAGDIRDVGLIPGSGRLPGSGLGNSFQYSCLGNPTDRGTWLQRVRLDWSDLAHTQTRMLLMKKLSMHADKNVAKFLPLAFLWSLACCNPWSPKVSDMT